MITLDKIKNTVQTEVLEAINTCARLGKTVTLRIWLANCKEEIARKQSQGEDTYSLFCEKEYLELLLS